ncbi:MAG TPA: hypothetical protein VFW11_18525 [Cyclobacteriaceae bacterium]|nr:hypothetical protein [Cyclobacteriaceae bacterium]
MDKNQFLQAIRSFSEVSIEEAKEICALREVYPYSQVLHALSARLAKDHNLPSAQHDLQLAAVYSADRAVLKEVMTKAQEVWPTSHEVAGLSHPEVPQTSLTSSDQNDADERATQDVADKVMQDLRTLSILKNNFESMLDDGTSFPYHADESAVDSGDQDTKRKLPPGRKPGNVKAHRIVELVKALEIEAEEFNDEDRNGKHQSEDIIETIQNSKKKINPESEKQKEQIEIIDQFIKAQPVISPVKGRVTTTNQEDFTSIKSGEFGDNVISETLVDILIHQGKKDKAVEVLKKLIWKFPQKKAYFAAQIEELKK